MFVTAESPLGEEELAALGVTAEILRDAVTAGELERLSCTELDPTSYPGTAAWGLRTRRLRELLLPRGWRYASPSNLPLVIEPVRRIAIVTTAGNEHTGDAYSIPSNKHPKGAMSGEQVQHNQTLLFEGQREFTPTPSARELVTWFLLVYAEFRPRTESAGDHVAHYELSLPSVFTENGFVVQWSRRIIFEPLRFDNAPRPLTTEEEEEVGVDVPVTRRA